MLKTKDKGQNLQGEGHSQGHDFVLEIAKVALHLMTCHHTTKTGELNT